MILLVCTGVSLYLWIRTGMDNSRRYYEGIVKGKSEIRMQVKKALVQLYPSKYRIMAKELLGE